MISNTGHGVYRTIIIYRRRNYQFSVERGVIVLAILIAYHLSCIVVIQIVIQTVNEYMLCNLICRSFDRQF